MHIAQDSPFHAIHRPISCIISTLDFLPSIPKPISSPLQKAVLESSSTLASQSKHPPSSTTKRKVKGPKILCEFLLHKLLQWSRSHGSGPIGTKATGLSQGKYQLLNFIKFEITAPFIFNMKEYIHILKICSVCNYLLRQHTPQNHAFIPSSWHPKQLQQIQWNPRNSLPGTTCGASLISL